MKTPQTTVEAPPPDNDTLNAVKNLAGAPLREMELYIFSRRMPPQSDSRPLFGLVDALRGGRILLESATHDMRTFTMWQPLPAEYRFCRPATREEKREFFWSLGFYDGRRNSTLKE